MKYSIIFFLILNLSIAVFAGSLKIRTIDSTTEQPIDETLISLKDIATSKVYRKTTNRGNTEFINLLSGNYLIKAEKSGFDKKTGRLQLDFNKKDYYSVSFKLIPATSKTKDKTDLKSIFQKNSEYYSTIQKAEVLEKNSSKTEELGILRANIAFGLYEKSLLKNNSKLFELAYQYAESGTELAHLSPYTWEVFGIINSSLIDSYKAAIISEDSFEICLELDPVNTKVMKLLANIYYRNEFFKKASMLIEEKLVIENKPPDSPDLALLNLCYIRGNLQNQGIAFFNFLMKKYPDNQYIKFQLSILYNNLGQKKEAVKLLSSIVSSPEADKQQKDYAKKLLIMNK